MGRAPSCSPCEGGLKSSPGCFLPLRSKNLPRVFAPVRHPVHIIGHIADTHQCGPYVHTCAVSAAARVAAQQCPNAHIGIHLQGTLKQGWEAATHRVSEFHTVRLTLLQVRGSATSKRSRDEVGSVSRPNQDLERSCGCIGVRRANGSMASLMRRERSRSVGGGSTMSHTRMETTGGTTFLQWTGLPSLRRSLSVPKR